MDGEGKSKGKGGRPQGRSPKLKDMLLAAGDLAALEYLAKRTASTPERVARGIIHAAFTREPETLMAEVERLALEEAKRAASGEANSEEAEASS